MIPMTFFVFSSSVGVSVRASAADFTPIEPSIARAIAMRASATRYFSTRFDRTAFARSRTRKNSTMSASCFSFRSLAPLRGPPRPPELEQDRSRRFVLDEHHLGGHLLSRTQRPTTVGRVVLLQGLPINFREPRFIEGGEQLPSDLECLLDRSVLLGPLADELLLEAIRELEHLAVPVREGLLPDDGDEPADVLPFRVRGVELVRDLLVILPCPVLADPGVHQSGQGRQRVDRR